MTKSILLLEDDLRIAEHWKALLEDAGYRIFHTVDTDDAIAVLHEESIDLILTDIFIRDSESSFKLRGGISLLAHASVNVRPSPKAIAITGASASLNIEAHVHIFRGAKTIVKPVSDEALLDAVKAELIEQ